jgi:CPA2 family monovalent cation:H+ antiporter-2
LRDAFGAIFFFHFGLSIDPGALWEVAGAVAVAVAMTFVLCLTAGIVAARIHGFGRTAGVNVGLTVLTRGEFSLVLATLALGAGLDPRVGSLAAGYVLVLGVLGPLAVAHSPRLARLFPRRWFATTPRYPSSTPLDLTVGTGALHRLGTELLQIRVAEGSRLHGVYVGELRLPAGSTLGLLARNGSTSALQPTTQMRTDDVLLLFTRPEGRAAAERRIRAVHRSGRLATWQGDVGD